MKKTEKNENLERFAESYIFEHPFTMFILIEKNQNDFDVLYANSLAREFFSTEVHQSAACFFKDLWIPIRRKMRKLHIHAYYKTEIEQTKDGIDLLYELVFQHREIVEGREYIYIELKERIDIAVERGRRMELQDKYMSVIDHNLDPVITINRKRKITYSNEAVYSTYGYRLKELSGRSILDLVKEDEMEVLQLFLSRVLAGELIEMEGASLFHKKGEYKSSHLKAIPVFVDGNIIELHLIMRDTSSYRESNKKLLYLSYHDQLTGLWNRRTMKEHFMEDAIYSLKSEGSLSFIHLGLDRFKLINESLGYSGADEILKMIAERLNNICPTSARLYRNGGDEFIVSLQNYSVPETEEFAQNLLNEFGNPFYYNQQEYFISASIGISVYPEDGTILEELLRKSEHALAFVKDRGRSHYRFYREEMNASLLDEALMESHLRRAVELDELAIHYQPQVNLKTGEINSFEALLRWRNPKFGFVSPAQFIPITEESGLIHKIGDWVLDQVCRQLKEWQEKQFMSVRIAVNISPKQFRMESFVGKVKEKILYYGIEPSSLEVEITESALTIINETLATLTELKKIGVVISVDDFGTGYSSLSYLKQYPIDIIKIDRSFIKDIEVDKKNEAIAKAIINLAHNLGMEVIAEGVEKDLQAQILLEANCQKAQGFLYSKAVPVEEIIEKYLIPH